MYRRFHDRFGTAGVVIGVIALIAALGGSALAAGGLTKQQEKQVTKIAKKYAGKPGATGPVGPAGSAGVKGDTGAKGNQGEQGIQGNTGTTGKSVVVGTATSTPAGECPTVGGATVEVSGEPATKKKVCNGAEGETGKTGSCCTPALGSGQSEQGSWSTVGAKNEVGPSSEVADISFTIPLAAELPAANTHYNEPETTNCPGTAEEPKAAAGHLCVYQGANFAGLLLEFILKSGSPFVEGASTSGAILFFAGEGSAWGTWAVTAP